MATKYDLTNYDSDEARNNNNNPEGPPQRNPFAAPSLIARLLTSNNIQYAVMGGLPSFTVAHVAQPATLMWLPGHQ
jgi:hypothetical protein